MLYNSKAFGIVISRLRTSKGMTQERMSGLAGIARSHLAALENGDKTVKISTLWSIAYALDMKPSELIRQVEKETEEVNDLNLSVKAQQESVDAEDVYRRNG